MAISHKGGLKSFQPITSQMPGTLAQAKYSSLVAFTCCRNYGNWELGISIFPTGLCPKLLDDTNKCQYILVHKILLQLKFYNCNSLLSTYIQRNNQKVENKNKNNFTNKIAFLIADVTFPIFYVLCKTLTFQMGFPRLNCAEQYFHLKKFGTSVIPMSFEHPISLKSIMGEIDWLQLVSEW